MKKYFVLLMVALMLIVPVASNAAPLYQGEDYTVQADDWLSKLSDKFLGDVLAYPAITYYTNQKNAEDDSYAQITDSDVIEVGQKLYIPNSEEVEAYFTTSEGESIGEGTIKIGAIVPLSAPGSVTGGTAMKAAMEIALEEINAEGGVLGQQVEMILLDTEGLPERGATAMERLINQEGVVAVAGAYHSAVGLAAKEVAHDNHIPVVFAETWNDDITGSGYEEVFRIAPRSSDVALIDAEFIATLKPSFVAIMTENTGYGIPAAEQTAEILTANGIESETFSADIGTLDFAPVVERMKAGTKPDVILVLLTGETGFNFAQQAAEAGLGPEDVTMICNQAASDSDSFWAAVPDGRLCLYHAIGLPVALWTDSTKAFAEKYVAATGRARPESYAMEAYDSLKMTAQAINDAGSTDPDAIIAALEAIDYNGALGRVYFDYGLKAAVPDGMPASLWHQFPEPAVTMVQFQETGESAADLTVVYPEAYKTGDMLLPGQ
jgi:ABC-type branched-subunit amino acid transport system substrate-binding protein